MALGSRDIDALKRTWRTRMDLTAIVAILALSLSALSFYRTFIYKSHRLEVTVSEVSYATNRGELYMIVAFSNAGNRDAALLRVEPALWGRRGQHDPEWIPLGNKVAEDVPLAAPKTPMIIRAGGVEVVTLSSKLSASDAEEAVGASRGAVYLGVRVATMNSDGNLYLVQNPVARLSIDSRGRIQSAEPAIHKSLSGFIDLEGIPPGDSEQANKKTPFVWADEHYR